MSASSRACPVKALVRPCPDHLIVLHVLELTAASSSSAYSAADLLSSLSLTKDRAFFALAR